MAQSERAAKRLRAIELFALGEEWSRPDAVAKALDVTEDELLKWRSRKSFNDAVLARSRQLYREAFPFVARRIIEQAEQGHPSAQSLYLKHFEYLETREAEKSADVWRVAWSTAPVVAAPPVTDKPEDPDGDE